MYELDNVVYTPENKDAIEAILNIPKKGSVRRIFFWGPEVSGKTHILREIARKFPKDLTFYCTTADLRLRLDLDNGDEFFEKIGSIPILFLDAFEQAFDHELCPELIRLLLLERERLDYATVIASRVPYTELEIGEMAAPLASFAVHTVAPLNEKDRAEAARRQFEDYRTKNSPAIEEGVFELIGSLFNDPGDAKNAAQYLARGTGLTANDTVTIAMAEEAFKH